MSFRSFLILGSESSDILSLLKGGLEISNLNYSFRQGIDLKGKATTKVYGGSINITLAQLPTHEITEWALDSRKYKDGMIVVLDYENMPKYKIVFLNASCTNFEINYTQSGQSYTLTKLSIDIEKMIVGGGIEFENEWTTNN